MQLVNQFSVPVPTEIAWKVLLDVERVALCMPGAAITGRDGDTFHGTVKVKAGPFSFIYGGVLRFVSLDEVARVAVIEATGKETRGNGTAKATIRCAMSECSGGSQVDVVTDLDITGKPAQFGRGVLADVSGRLVAQFAARLSEEISSQPGPMTATAVGVGLQAPAAGFMVQRQEGGEALDLFGAAGFPVLKRLAPLLAAAVVVLVLVLLWRR